MDTVEPVQVERIFFSSGVTSVGEVEVHLVALGSKGDREGQGSAARDCGIQGSDCGHADGTGATPNEVREKRVMSSCPNRG